MNASKYKTTKTTRGLTYNYFFSAAQSSEATLFFLHGFPSSSYDWHYQVEYFVKEGYGVLVPDMLGYAGTDKPTDPEMYTGKAMCQDLVDILDAEKLEKVVVIGHDWGCYPTSQIWNYHPERVAALAFFAVSYIPPHPARDIPALNAMTKQLLGYEIFGYQIFFASEGTDKKIESHLDSFMSILFPSDPSLWTTNMAPLGAFEDWLMNDRTSPRPSYMSAEELEKHKAPLAKHGFSASLNWYKNSILGLSKADDAAIPMDRVQITVPTFFGAALKDFVCLAQFGKDAISKNCTNATIKDFDTDHWVQLAEPDKVNTELHEWLKASGV